MRFAERAVHKFRNTRRDRGHHWRRSPESPACDSCRGTPHGEGNEDDNLRNATLSSMRVANDHGLKSIAFPVISTGILGFPLDRCARIMVGTTVVFLQQGPTGLASVVFCLFSAVAFEVFQEEIERQDRKEP